MKIYIDPKFETVDNGDGGIRQVVNAQRKWLPKFGFEVVDSVEESDIVASHAGNMPNVPVNKPWVVHTHGLYWDEYEWANWAKDLNKRVIDCMRRADHVTAPSKWVAHALARGMWLSPTVLYHGVDFETWQGGHNGNYVLWNKTRVDPVCDPRPVNEVAKLLPDVNFISTYGEAAPNVKLTGRLPFLKSSDLVRNAGVYLCTTRETMGIGTLEAMAAGVPVVGWKWGGQVEVIEHKVTGYLCPPGDFKGLAEGIKWALENRAEIGQKCQEDALNRWTWEKAIERYAVLYKSLLEKRNQPKVSVIMPCYKLAQYLPDAIESIQSQTLKDWELIVVDDHSPDNTSEVAQKYTQDSRIRIIRNPKNLYLAGALNAGISQSKGRYIINVDADNMLAPRALEELSSALDKDRGIHIAYGAVKFIKADKSPDTSISPDGLSKWPGEFSFSGQMKHFNQLPSTSMYRREVWERTLGYRTRCRTAEDAEFWTRAVSLGFQPKRVTSGITLIYRQLENSMSRVNKDWDWTAWLPWTRNAKLIPFGAVGNPSDICWPVPIHDNPKIAVIIAVGPGHEKIVIDALDSVEAQTFRDWECIVINDTGHPLKVHPWAHVIETKGKQGPAIARNLGVTKSKAPLFIPLDADDYLQPGALETLYTIWKETDGVIYSQWFDDKGDKTEIYDPPDYDPKILISKGCIHAVTALYPKSIWETLKGFDPDMQCWEDWDFQIGLADRGICEYKVNAPLFTYRKTTGLRREEAVTNFEKGKEEILKKWGKYWKGENFMACGGCGRKVAPVIREETAHSGAVLLEFIGTGENTLTFRGSVTKTSYRFGNNPGHKRKYVYAQDAPALLAIRNQFIEVKQEVKVESQPVLKVETQPEVKPVLEAKTEVSEAPEELSITALKKIIPSKSKEDLALMLAQEKSGSNRSSAIKMLEKALKE